MAVAAGLNVTAGSAQAVSAEVPSSVALTSVTLDPENSSGQTTNAPGAWSTNTGYPLCQVGVMADGASVNQDLPGQPDTLGEVALQLKRGINQLRLFGTTLQPGNAFYGLVLYLDGRAVGPQIAVYNSNPSSGVYSAQPAGTTIIGSANGGVFFDSAPGTPIYTAPDGTTVEVLSFTIDATTVTNPDRVACARNAR